MLRCVGGGAPYDATSMKFAGEMILFPTSSLYKSMNDRTCPSVVKRAPKKHLLDGQIDEIITLVATANPFLLNPLMPRHVTPELVWLFRRTFGEKAVTSTLSRSMIVLLFVEVACPIFPCRNSESTQGDWSIVESHVHQLTRTIECASLY